MKRQQEVLQAMNDYLECFPEEREELTAFRSFIERFDDPQLYDRKNFVGHITASGIIYNPTNGKILLLFHKQLQKWLQPGGHVEADDVSILAAAQREIREETGLAPDEFSQMFLIGNRLPILDMNTHYIPPCDAKHEEEHYHHDVRFLFALRHENRQVIIDRTESNGYRWVLPEELPAHFGFGRIREKLPRYTL